MNASKILTRLENSGVTISAQGERLRVLSKKPLSKTQSRYLKHHKLAILAFLKLESANQLTKRYAYRFSFSDGKGGTYITDETQALAKKNLIDNFCNRQLDFFVLLN